MVNRMNSRILKPEELLEVLDKLIDKIQTEVFQANALGNVYDVFQKYGCEELIDASAPSYSYIDLHHSKILVLAFQLNQDDLRKAAKQEGVDPNRIDFVEYSPGFDYGKLRYSSKYSDVLVGPIPHMGKNIGDASSFLSAYEQAPEEYPKVQRLEDSTGTLKVTKTAFVSKLKMTRLLQEVI